MDPRERLKRYLEQRRELGESELVLDGMSVEEVMSIVSGAIPGSKPPRKPRDADAESAGRGGPDGPADVVVGEGPDRESAERGAETPRSAPDPDAAPSTDWRAALRASGAAPESRGESKPPRDRPADAAATPADRPVAPKPESPVRPPDPQRAGTARASAPGAMSPSTSRKYEFPAPADVADRAARGASSASQPPPTTPLPDGGSPPVAPAGPQPAQRIPGVDAPLGLVVGDAGRDLFGTSIGKIGSLAEIAEVVAGCTRCPLYSTATNPVPGEGNPNAELVCVGEAPGANEDATGRPFVGQSGELLTKILAAISLRREDVFICNVLKHRPPGNRNPMPEEVVACSPYLVQQLELIRPKVIVAFGTFAAQTLLNTKLPIGKLRGSVHRYHGIPLIVTYHPAALLRNPAWKRPTWEDVQLARRILDNAPRA